MKKALCILFTILMLAATLSGCAGKTDPLGVIADPLWIVVDFGSIDISYVEAALTDLKSFMVHTAGIPEEDFVFECLPIRGSERDTAIDRIRTEIMSGEGPDLFIVQCRNSLRQPLLFEMPEKAMELGYFLPLDEYIENAEYAEWDKFTKTIMDAGRNKEGQQLVPLAYKLPAAMYREEDVSHTPTNMTWEELKSEEALQDAVQRLGAGLPPSGPWDGSYDFPIDYLLGVLADYQNEELMFTEEELLRYATEICETTKYYEDNKLYEVPYSTKSSLGVGFNSTGDGSGGDGRNLVGNLLNGITEHDALTLVPLYSDDGGCTALVTSFAAINRNTDRPEEAFKVLDQLMSTHYQCNSTLFREFIYYENAEPGMPVHSEVMSEQFVVRGHEAHNYWFSLTPENFEAVSTVREQITEVQFCGSLNDALETMMINCYIEYMNGEDYTQTVHETYGVLRQMMAE